VDGYGACFTAARYPRWQDEYDVSRRLLPADRDFRDFRDRLEAEYRDRMKRPANRYAGTADDRLTALVRFLSYRLSGCDHDEASALTLQAPPAARLCRRQSVEPRPLPPTDDALGLRRALASRWAQAAETDTHVDAAGEAIWVHAYAQHRLEGRSHQQSVDAVLASIRAIAP
jgi:hypothetical protein